MPLHNDKAPAKFQAFVSSYLLDSLATSYLEVDPVNLWTRHDQVPKSVPINLTTSGLDMFFPGLEAHYGKDLPIDIEYLAENVGNFSSSENDQTLHIQLDAHMKFWVLVNSTYKETAVDFVIQGLNTSFSALVVDKTKIQFSVSSFGIGAIKILSTTFGNIDLAKVTELLDEGIKFGLSYLNDYLKTLQVQVPTNLFDLFVLSDLDLKYHDNYIEAGLTPTFLPPKEPLFVPEIPVMHDEPNYYFEAIIDEDGTEHFRQLKETHFGSAIIHE